MGFAVRSVRMSIFSVFVCYELWVKVPVAIFSSMVLIVSVSSIIKTSLENLKHT